MFTRDLFNLLESTNGFYPTHNGSAIRLSSKAVYETKDDTELQLAYSVLGYGQDDVSVETIDNKLKIKANKSDEGITGHLISNIDETITINKDYDVQNANCSIKNGILLITIPKKEESLAKKLQIKLLN